jgi:uncharacterized membrane protein
MDERAKKRIIMFYVGGIINALLGLYVVIEGASFLAPDTVRMLAIIFFVFAAVDFYFPHAIKKKWLAEQAKQGRQGIDPVQRP